MSDAFHLERFVAAQDPVYADVVAELRSAEQIFGSIDAQKLQSCLTLFELASDGNPAIVAALEKYYDGRRDATTLQLLGGDHSK